MLKLILSLLLAGAFIMGGLVALLRNRREPMGSPEVLERAKQRNLKIEEQERRESED